MQAAAQQSTINPAFAGHFAEQLREATGDLHSVFDNLRDIASGDRPNANTYDRLRATRILLDRGFGKVSKNPSRTKTIDCPVHGDSAPRSKGDCTECNDTESRGACTECSGTESKPALSLSKEGPVERLEHKLDDSLGPPQAPAECDDAGETNDAAEPDLSLSKGPHGLPAPSPGTPGYNPDLVRDSQYYVLEITNYGADLVSILVDIHEADPDDESVRECHRVTAGQMIIDRVIGPATDLAQSLGHAYDPTEDPNWMTMHPAEIDAEVTPEELMKADRATRELLDDYRDQIASCEVCTDEYPCDEHYRDEDETIMSARVFRNMRIYGDRIYFDLERGGVKLHPRGYIDDS